MSKTKRIPGKSHFHIYSYYEDEGWVWENYHDTRQAAEAECKRCFCEPTFVASVRIPAVTVEIDAEENSDG